MTSANRKHLIRSTTPEIWSLGHQYLGSRKTSGVAGVFRAMGSGASRLAGGLKSVYRKSLPPSTWRDAASLPERVAERVGFFALPAAGAYYLARKRRRPDTLSEGQAAALSGQYVPY